MTPDDEPQVSTEPLTGQHGQAETTLMDSVSPISQLRPQDAHGGFFTPLVSFARVIENGITLAGDFVVRFTEGLVRGFVALEPVLRQLGDALEAWLTSSMDSTLRRYHWWYLPVMPRVLVAEIAEMAEQGGGRSVTARICQYYRANRCRALRELIASWDDVPYFARRKAIFRACLRAHSRREYALSIPALLPHIEGVALEFFLDLGIVKMNMDWPQFIETLGPPQSKSQSVMTDSFADALLGTFYSFYRPSQEYNGTLPNRHAIAHGRLLKYSSEANSLRSFLVLGTLHYFLHELLCKQSLDDIKAVLVQATQQSSAPRPRTKALSTSTGPKL